MRVSEDVRKSLKRGSKLKVKPTRKKRMVRKMPFSGRGNGCRSVTLFLGLIQRVSYRTHTGPEIFGNAQDIFSNPRRQMREV
jgi:hypothetical protein